MTYINLDLECRVDKDADGRITEEEIKEVQYKIINSPLTVQTSLSKFVQHTKVVLLANSSSLNPIKIFLDHM